VSLKVKVISKRNPQIPEESPKFYASARHDRKIGLAELATDISNTCSLRRSDVHGVIVALMDIIPRELCEGSILNLGTLGSFYVTVKSASSETAEAHTVSLVKGAKIQYRPSKELRNQLKSIDISYAK